MMTWTMWEEALAGILKFSRDQFAGTLRFEIEQKPYLGWFAEGSIELEPAVQS